MQAAIGCTRFFADLVRKIHRICVALREPVMGNANMGRSELALDIITKLWPLGRVVNWLGGRPLIGPLFRPCFSAEGSEAVIIPVQETVRGTESVVLPYPLLPPLLERASARFIKNECLCRRAENCQTYPQDVGCIFLGDGAAEINPAMGRLVNVGEAMAHVRRAMEIGLVPLIVHSSLDAWMLGIPYRRMLAVCLCCDCCCTVREGLRLGPPAFWDTVLRLPGLTVSVGPGCVGCGTCVGVCHVSAISLDGGRAHIGERCKGCGRCAAVCPNGAITLRLADDVDVLDCLRTWIEQRTYIGLAESG
jgi:ferredoxin